MRVEAPCNPQPLTSLAHSVLREIGAHLAALAAGGDVAAIDLRSLPLTPADRSDLQQALGRGDVEAVLDVAGSSEIWETAYAGVWWVRHFGTGDRIAAERIEITPIPDILMTDEADIAAACARLHADLDAQPDAAQENGARV